MITKLGRIEEKILDILRYNSKKNIDLCLKIFGKADEVKRSSINQSCNSLIKKGLIKKKEFHFVFVKDLDIISQIRVQGKNQKIVSIPSRKKTKNWKKGDKIKLINLNRK